MRHRTGHVRRTPDVDAMIFAAGLGTRLRPLTDRIPKALVEVGGQTLLERTARRLIAAGADRLVVNVHHFADLIETHLEALALPADVRVSREAEAPLETGGGLLHARSLFHGDRPFFIHNADIVSDVQLEALAAAHGASDALVTLAVMARDSARTVLFDANGLFGHANRDTGTRVAVREPEGDVVELPFCGIHVASPRLLHEITETGRFSIFTLYLRLAAAGERILPFRADGARWIDVGRPASLELARRTFE